MTTAQRNPSPFRYPGSKQALAEYMRNFMAANGYERPHFYEPFAGGASLSLELLSSDSIRTATWVERDPLVYSFWKCVRRSPEKLCARLWKLPINLKTWNDFQIYKEPDAHLSYELIDLAVAGIFFNRVNFSGLLGAKPIGGMGQSSDYSIDCRWNTASLVDKICHISTYGSRIRVCQGDAVNFLKRSKKRIAKQNEKRQALIYVDPPYYVQGPKLYRHFFKDEDHERLASYLNGFKLPWICSYDDHPKIHDLFAGQGRIIVPINLQYTVRRNRRVDELLITNCQYLPRPTSDLLLAESEQATDPAIRLAQ